jgi:hypothetical protein
MDTDAETALRELHELSVIPKDSRDLAKFAQSFCDRVNP